MPPLPAHLLLLALIAAPAAAIGSFCGALVVRWPQGRSVMRGRSGCDSCGAALGWPQLIPLVSWAMLRGRCARCGAAIDPAQPLAEAAGVVIGLAPALWLPLAQAWPVMVFGWLLLPLILLDARHFWLPDALVLVLALVGGLVVLGGYGAPWPQALAGALAGFGTLWLLARFYRWRTGHEGLGGGDAKLLGAIGIWTGVQPVPMVLLVASLGGLAWAGWRQWRHGGLTGQTRLPLGTLMGMAAWLIMLHPWPLGPR